MNMRDLISWRRGDSQTAVSPELDEAQNAFLSLHREVDRLMDTAFRAFSGGSGAVQFAIRPSIEISETPEEIVVTAEVPGIKETDIDVTLSDGSLILRGEKISETREDERRFSEISYGCFERRIPLHADIDEQKIDARFSKGILTIVLPKTASNASNARRIEINR